MLEEFFINTLRLNKEDVIKLERLMFENIWQSDEFYNFLCKHQKHININQKKEAIKKLKEMGDILNEKS